MAWKICINVLQNMNIQYTSFVNRVFSKWADIIYWICHLHITVKPWSCMHLVKLLSDKRKFVARLCVSFYITRHFLKSDIWLWYGMSLVRNAQLTCILWMDFSCNNAQLHISATSGGCTRKFPFSWAVPHYVYLRLLILWNTLNFELHSLENLFLYFRSSNVKARANGPRILAEPTESGNILRHIFNKL